MLEKLKGKKFKSISDNDYGGIKIEFEDGTVGNFEVCTFPDGMVSDIFLNEVTLGENNG